ncbi:hypothetical protein [Lentibacillus sediminis]|uniref:hypothetical protein n=1 Tax=Lentibacillus sediminis TaxID=1940529 RepID=UPI000C1C7169|nr:hypothetical protein [Lentibacillus sediminis]
MELRIEKGILLAKVALEFHGEELLLNNVIVDTGSSDTIFDTDLLAEIGLFVDYVNGIPTVMYGVGGKGEVCNQQLVSELYVDGQSLNQFPLQLGMTQDIYGFDGFIGLDFMMKTNMVVDFAELAVIYKEG